MSEPCRHEQYAAAVSSFVATNREAVRAEATVARVIELCDVADRDGMDISSAEVRQAINQEAS